MERRYLVAALALVATFAIFSRGLRDVRTVKLPSSHAELMAELSCARHYVARQLLARLEPDAMPAAPQQARVIAELQLPELARVEQQAAQAQLLAQQQVERLKCEAAKSSPKAKPQVIQMRVLSRLPSQPMADLSVVKAEYFSDRAQQWADLAQVRGLEIQVKALSRSQEISVKAMERAQRAIEKSHLQMASPAVPGMPIHINFAAPTPMAAPAPAALEAPSASVF